MLGQDVDADRLIRRRAELDAVVDAERNPERYVQMPPMGTTPLLDYMWTGGARWLDGRNPNFATILFDETKNRTYRVRGIVFKGPDEKQDLYVQVDDDVQQWESLFRRNIRSSFPNFEHVRISSFPVMSTNRIIVRIPNNMHTNSLPGAPSVFLQHMHWPRYMVFDVTILCWCRLLRTFGVTLRAQRAYLAPLEPLEELTFF